VECCRFLLLFLDLGDAPSAPLEVKSLQYSAYHGLCDLLDLAMKKLLLLPQPLSVPHLAQAFLLFQVGSITHEDKLLVCEFAELVGLSKFFEVGDARVSIGSKNLDGVRFRKRTVLESGGLGLSFGFGLGFRSRKRLEVIQEGGEFS